jgi:TRAP-type C4-dicarboxylate transport system permease small subunit
MSVPERARQVLTVVGSCCVVLGGLVAAITGPFELAHGSWLAAYLVLVGGVTQYAMGRARVWWPDAMQPRSWGWTQVGSWNAGNALVIGGTLGGEPVVVDLGSVLLIAAVGIALHAARPAARAGASPTSPLVGLAYRTLMLVLAVSIPVGMVLSHLRHS